MFTIHFFELRLITWRLYNSCDFRFEIKTKRLLVAGNEKAVHDFKYQSKYGAFVKNNKLLF